MTLPPDVAKSTKIETTITRTTTVRFTAEEAEKLLRAAVGAPLHASVKFDCGFEVFNEVVISWVEAEQAE